MATLATDVHSCFERKYLASERRRINRQPLHWIAAGGEWSHLEGEWAHLEITWRTGKHTSYGVLRNTYMYMYH